MKLPCMCSALLFFCWWMNTGCAAVLWYQQNIALVMGRGPAGLYFLHSPRGEVALHPGGHGEAA